MAKNKTPKSYVFLSEFFANDARAFIEERFNSAFKNNGAEFWQNFFSCSKNHPDSERFIYLFTEQQLKILYDLYNNKLNADKETKHNLECSKQEWLLATKEDSDGFVEALDTCCIMNEKNALYDFKQLIFKDPKDTTVPLKKNEINFLEGKFNQKGPYTPTSVDDREEHLQKTLVNLKSKITQTFHNPSLEGNWVFYFGKKYKILRIITFCKVVMDAGCPLFKKPTATASDHTTISSPDNAQ